MQKGIPLSKLVNKVDEQSLAKRDFMVNTEAIRMLANGKELQIDGGQIENLRYKISKTTHRQLGNHLDIPAKYYDKLLNQFPSLLAQNVNTWLHSERTSQVVRTLDYAKIDIDGENLVRAFLSSQYRPIDNSCIKSELLPLIKKMGGKIKSCNITETHLYIHAAFPDVKSSITKNEDITNGIIIRNSEVGLSALKIQPWLQTSLKGNGIIIPDTSIKKYHVGKSRISSDLAYEINEEKSGKNNNPDLWSQIKQIVLETLDESVFEKTINSFSKKTRRKIAEPEKSVKLITNLFTLTSDESNQMLKAMLASDDFSKWGVANAIASLAHNVNSYDRAVEYQEIAGRVMELPNKNWS